MFIRFYSNLGLHLFNDKPQYSLFFIIPEKRKTTSVGKKRMSVQPQALQEEESNETILMFLRINVSSLIN